MRLITTVFAILVLAPALAEVPESLNYQGYLTDRDGAAMSDELLITFSIYTVELGGSPLWSDTLLVDVENGLFSVQLGRAVNQFPVDLFETPLWLGITVESDNEMIPRRALTSVGFSFKAEDAESVQGKSAFELDQSDHVSNLSNPHGVTAAQAGAVQQIALDAHTTDVTNPHEVTAAQSGAAEASIFGAHTADSSAHHSRYSDVEAFGAVLGADGPGSNLDADTLDGLQGTELALSSNTYDINEVDNLLQTLQSQIDALAQQPRFEDRGDGTVRDTLTGLVWLKDASCPELADTDSEGRAFWIQADRAPRNLVDGQCGLSDGSVRGEWYLPTRQEFATILDRRFSSPALSNADGTSQWTEGDTFVGVQSAAYWTSTPDQLNTVSRAWEADLVSGYLNDDVPKGSTNNYVWPVRLGR